MRVDAVFHDPNLIGDAGLVPVVRLAERARLGELVAEAVRITGAGNWVGQPCGESADFGRSDVRSGGQHRRR
ncbi:hypothetical protein ACWDKQ_10855 [Saccharopolyspora sp. NPDC000995]